MMIYTMYTRCGFIEIYQVLMSDIRAGYRSLLPGIWLCVR